eukprot:1838674-Prymnesium_polylepis.1
MNSGRTKSRRPRAPLEVPLGYFVHFRGNRYNEKTFTQTTRRAVCGSVRRVTCVTTRWGYDALGRFW